MPYIIIVIGLVLIIFNYRAIKRENNSFEIQDKDNSFRKILNDNKNEMTDYKLELGLLRKNLGESLTELQEEILEIKTRLQKIENNNGIVNEKKDICKEITGKSQENISKDVISEISILNNEDIEMTTAKLNFHSKDCFAMSGHISKEDRKLAIESFRKGHIKILVSSDVTARGLDV